MKFGKVVKNVLHKAEHIVSNPVSQKILQFGERIPGPIGLASHGIVIANDVAHRNYIGAAKDAASMIKISKH